MTYKFKNLINNEYKELTSLLQGISFPHTIILDMRKTTKHWFLSYDYFFVRNDFKVSSLRDDMIYHSCFKNKDNFFLQEVTCDVLESIKRYWSDRIEIGSILVFAWSHQSVEKDCSLFYLYDKQNNYKGVYCHSLNWSEDIVYVGQGVKTFFNLKQAELELKKVDKLNKNYFLPRKKKSKIVLYTEILKEDEFLILDSEFGFDPSFVFYKDFIDNTLVPLTKNSLKYSALLFEDNDNEILKFTWQTEGQDYKFKLDSSSDYIDGDNFYPILNLILRNLGVSKSLVVFRHYDFGQEYGLAYIDAKKQTKLGELFEIELVDTSAA